MGFGLLFYEYAYQDCEYTMNRQDRAPTIIHCMASVWLPRVCTVVIILTIIAIGIVTRNAIIALAQASNNPQL